ncbi:MAG: hypothetical protein GQ557_02265 [Mycoplasmataceae bacterium]|nr:hypothetical protein [Mycoplasmataceae bacterium]
MNLITNTDTSVLPYNDDYLVYDLDSRQFLLTVSGVKDLLGYDLTNDIGTIQEANYFCLECSDIIYGHIYSYSNLNVIEQKRYSIAKDEDLREIIKRALLAQMRYMVKSGANLLGNMHGVNIERGKALDISKLRGNIIVSDQSHKLLSQSGLLHTGYQYIYDFEEDGSF